jgi:hypothetical protein
VNVGSSSVSAPLLFLLLPTTPDFLVGVLLHVGPLFIGGFRLLRRTLSVQLVDLVCFLLLLLHLLLQQANEPLSQIRSEAIDLIQHKLQIFLEHFRLDNHLRTSVGHGPLNYLM